MNTFELRLQSTTQYEDIKNVVSFVGEDASGKFGVLAGHARMMTCLTYGLAIIRYDNNELDYLALPGGVLYVIHNKVLISTQHYLRNTDYQMMLSALDANVQREERNVNSVKHSLQRLDEEMLKHLWTLKKQGSYETR